MARAQRRPPPPVRPEFEFVVVGQAVSAQAKQAFRVTAWKAKVAAAARALWPGGMPVRTDAVTVRITDFALSKTRDLDNVANPILDAMQGIVYANDRQVWRVAVNWEPIAGTFQALHMSPLVAHAFSRGDDFVWIRVDTHAANPELTR